MINTTNNYREEIKSENRILHNRAQITFADGTVKTVEDKELLQFSVSDDTSNNGSFDIGAAIAKQLTLKIDNMDDSMTNLNFSGAVIEAKTGLEAGTHTEWLNKGIFYAEPGKDTGDIITISAFDDMTKFDVSYEKSKLVYPATLKEILLDACNCCEVSLAADMASFDNSDFTVDSRPDDSVLTFRQVIQWVAQIACKYAKINNDRKLTLQWYDTSALEETISDMENDIRVAKIDTLVSGSSIETDDVVITGIKVIEENNSNSVDSTSDVSDINDDTETNYQYGTDGYVLEISGNKLIQNGKGGEVAEFIGQRMNGIRFRPLTAVCRSDPSVESGDIGLITDWKGRQYKTILTGVQYNGGGTQTCISSAESPERLSSERYSEATKVYKDLRKNLSRNKTEWEKAMENLKKAMESSKGLYPVIKTNEDGSKVYYMCDHPTLEESEVVFELNAKGWAVSTDGGKTWNAGLTVDGTMITKILNTIGLNADWINSGAFVVKNSDGDILFRADTDKGEVYINATTLKLTGKTVEEIAQDSAKKYVDAVAGEITNDINTQYFYAYDPDLTNVPASGWTDDEKEKHLNDFFYNTDTKKIFRFTKKDASYFWEEFTDPDIENALEGASKAQDTADGKRRIFVNTPTTPYDAGDMWVTSMEDGKGKIKICKISRDSGSFNSSDWIFPGYADTEDIQGAINEYDTSLGQTEVFNKLTDGGKKQGIYIENGKLYINADYILSGVLAGKYINAKGITVKDQNNRITFDVDSNGNVVIQPTSFALTNGDTIYSVAQDKANSAAGSALSDAKSYADGLVKDIKNNKMTKQEIINVLSDNSNNKGLYLINGELYINASYINTGELAGWTVDATNQILKSKGKTYGGILELDGGSGRIYARGNSNVYVPGVGTVYGTSIEGSTIETGTLHSGGVTAATVTATDVSATSVAAKGTVSATGKVTAGTHIEATGHFYSVGTGTDLADASIRGELQVTGKATLKNLVNVPNAGTGTGTDAVITSYGYIRKKSSSSKRYKKHLSFMQERDIEELINLRPVYFEYKEDYLDKEDADYKRPIPGFYAELVEKYFPEAVRYNEKGQPEDWDPKKLLPGVLRLVQYQHDEIKDLKEEIVSLNDRLNKLEEILKGVVK